VYRIIFYQLDFIYVLKLIDIKHDMNS